MKLQRLRKENVLFKKLIKFSFLEALEVCLKKTPNALKVLCQKTGETHSDLPFSVTSPTPQ
jgi:hypothetical protein